MYQPKVILIVMDGWGYSEVKEGNAIALAKAPNFEYLWQNYPHALIEAAGEPVGLPWGNVGSSEVGHTCLGSGRIINQDLPRVTKAITSGLFFKNPVLLEALNFTKKNNSSLHFTGLVSAGGVHSHINHLFALLELLKQNHFQQPSFIHMFTDGRDTPIKTALLYVNKLNEKIKVLGLNTQIATVVGRYYAMDRDSHWERTFSAYNCMVLGKGEVADSPGEAVLRAYVRGETDEFIKPTTITGQTREQGLIKDNDAMIFFNFRPERIRQLVETFILPQQNFPDKKLLKNLFVASLVEYEKSLPIRIVLPSEKIENPLAKMISAQNLKQLHIAETEKYAHITYFFDGGNPVPFSGEEWKVIPSPKVKTYDLKPEMSAVKVTDEIFRRAKEKQYDFILINYANADMVGHTGNLPAAIKAVETIDQELGRLTKQFKESIFLITADHGNAEKMINVETGQIDTEHSVLSVPFMLVGPQYKRNAPEDDGTKPIGILADIAPTILDILRIDAPPEMTGYSLLDALL
ncbi:MAG: 2,3-bisphosphoglycerate-independent phosphoglycerate mutase [Berkelbacteria bacterium GW2011_GWA1_36_9]|uniref:2,3-bisphosphoglycerate-independent phosphoglycerate mutase n=1 Tax=Berkelbacteria bacterium GW2011_GWA1_36_9 TaxID=1618331 RepID=A0A0G0FI09_9BACT|nr:MAG: 2,3-bisphosphoglycerate-independent phosphoglycerate mutase [Berkelbacteria bacterium GW2011_GWA1_36_9]